MPGKAKHLFIFVLLLPFFLLEAQEVFAQKTLLAKKITFSVSNMPVVNVLNKIAVNTGVKFSYNPELIPSARRITKRFINQPLNEIIKEILDDPSISVREIGNQIVLFRGNAPPLPADLSQNLIIGKTVVLPPGKKNPDTLFAIRTDTLIINKTDTIFRSVSIMHFDTLRTMDTVYIENGKTKLNWVPSPLDEKADSLKRNSVFGSSHLYSGLYFEFLPGSIKYSNSNGLAAYEALMDRANSPGTFNFSTGIMAGYEFRKIGIRSGIGYMQLGENFAYSFANETGGFYKTDTVEKYYTLTGIDTNWFYVTDSAWIPKEVKHFEYKNQNRYRYFEVPFSVKLILWQNKTAQIYALGGINAGFLIGVSALNIENNDEFTTVNTSKRYLSRTLFSYHAGIGTTLKLSSRSGLLAEATYRKQLNDQYKDFPVEKKYGLWGFKFGVLFKI